LLSSITLIKNHNKFKQGHGLGCETQNVSTYISSQIIPTKYIRERSQQATMTSVSLIEKI